jgi:UDP-N-acetylmuramoyl-L-alanyl-D-glutamate--2,6-diaminopimelate ligase
VRPGDLFAALRGEAFDGHAFVAEAERRGAAALLVERPLTSTLPRIEVADSRAALAAIAAAFFHHPSREIGVIGITGTDGKTTTSYLTDHILRTAGLRTGMIGTVAIRVGQREDVHASRQTTPESSDVQSYLRQMADAGGDWAILEATSHGLAMHRLDNVRFCIGAVPNLTHEHLDFHGSVEAYRQAKAVLVSRVAAENGVVVINGDDPGALSVVPYARGASILHFSMTDVNADLRARDIHSDATGSRFLLDAGSRGRAEIALPLIGGFNIANALCAAGVAIATGIELRQVAAALAAAPAVPGRMARVQCGQPYTVVVDYAHTPNALAGKSAHAAPAGACRRAAHCRLR